LTCSGRLPDHPLADEFAAAMINTRRDIAFLDGAARFECLKKLLNAPPTPIGIYDKLDIRSRLDRLCRKQPPANRGLVFGWVDLFHNHNLK
jgi:hypothetical protein